MVYYARAAFIPVAIALLLSLVLATPVKALYRRGLPRILSSFLILLMFVALLGQTVNLLWTPAENWWAAAPQTLRTIQRKVRPVTVLMNRMSALTDRAGQIAGPPGPTAAAASAAVPAAPAPVAAPPPASVAQVLDRARTALVGIVTVAILTLFLMAGGPPMFARMSAALASDLQSTRGWFWGIAGIVGAEGLRRRTGRCSM